MTRLLLLLEIVVLCACNEPERPKPTHASDTSGSATVRQSGPPPSTRAPDSLSDELIGAQEVLRAYYDAINRRDFARAYHLWADSGRASGLSQEAFTKGFASTRTTGLTFVSQGRLEGAAGSRYAEIPVVVEAITRNDLRQRFEGRYVLRRSVVDGASSEQMQWRIHSAAIREVR